MIPIPLRAYVILGVVLLLAIAEGVLLWRVYHDGEKAQLRADLAAVTAHDRLVSAQLKKDHADAATIITQLGKDLAGARAQLQPQLPFPPRPLRVCVARSSDPGRPALDPPARAQPAQPARPGDDPGVLGGDQPGPDIAADVQALAGAGVVLAIYRQRTVDWALKQSQPLPGSPP